jgi:hypothetical protein
MDHKAIIVTADAVNQLAQQDITPAVRRALLTQLDRLRTLLDQPVGNVVSLRALPWRSEPMQTPAACALPRPVPG